MIMIVKMIIALPTVCKMTSATLIIATVITKI